MPTKSIFRQPGARHFQLVHRSQRDPLINDLDASPRVLKPFERENPKKGKSRADLESILSPDDLADGNRIGEASLYGIYYDDTEYDYMRHLRPVGEQEDGVESILIEAPSSSKKTHDKAKKDAALLLPDGVLASTSELPKTYESQQAIPESIAGFQPDMDAHLRQVLEALEDDAFVDDGLEDDFFNKLVADGERGSDEKVEFEFREEGIDGNAGLEDARDEEGEISWEKRFSNFKKSQNQAKGSDDGYSDDGDTVGTLPTISVIGGKGKRRRKGTSDASGYSMSSSSMYRTEALQTLDEQFDQMINNEYNEEEEEDAMSNEDDDDDEAPQLITSREDFDSMVNSFLNDYEVVGRKMKLKLEGESGAERLEVLRQAMGHDERVLFANEDDENEEEVDHIVDDEDDKKDKWDCETILTTYTNLENHPRLIRARNSQPVPKVLLDPKTGLPSISNPAEKTDKKPSRRKSIESENFHLDNNNIEVTRQTISRPQNESKEEKKLRKSAVKLDRQIRRVEKKSTKEQFDAEVKQQQKQIINSEKRMKKL